MDPGTLDRTGSPRPPRPPPTALWPPSDDEDEEEAVEYESSKTGDIEGAYEFTTQVLGKGSVAVVRSAVNIQTKEVGIPTHFGFPLRRVSPLSVFALIHDVAVLR